VTLKAKGGGNPANNIATADYTKDVYNDDVPPVNSTTGLQILAASISGYVYNDVNTNGFGGDAAFPDVSVSLYTDRTGRQSK